MRRHRGFTLVEALIVTVVLLLVSGMALAIAQTGPRVWSQTSERLASITDAQRALDRLTEDLRLAQTASLNCAPAAPDELTFTQTRLVGGVYTNVAVAYNHQGTQLLKDGNVVATEIAAFQPTCLSDGEVVLQLTVRVDASSTRTLLARVRTRQ